MRITKIEVMLTEVDPTMLVHFRPILCRVHTDEGIYGDGEAAIAYSAGAPAAYGMLRDLAPLVIGLDPFDTEVIWDKLYQKTFWARNGGAIVFSGMSAIDMALWDIKGKALNLPVYRLLGGKFRSKLRAYASQLQSGWAAVRVKCTEPAQYKEAALCAKEEGFDCVKYDFFSYAPDGREYHGEDYNRILSRDVIRMLEKRTEAVREAMGEGDIIVESHARPNANAAVQIGQALEKYGIFYYEEPNTPTPKMTKYIRDNVNIPLASGERIISRWQYAPYFENNSLQVIQPDMGNCGGITETKKICDMAFIYDVNVQLHVCASPLSTAAALHLEAAIPNFLIHEHHVNALSDFMRRLCINEYRPVNGQFGVPELPGLGNELSDYALTHCEKLIIS